MQPDTYACIRAEYDKMLAFHMGFHSRLGEKALHRQLDHHVASIIAAYTLDYTLGDLRDWIKRWAAGV